MRSRRVAGAVAASAIVCACVGQSADSAAPDGGATIANDASTDDGAMAIDAAPDVAASDAPIDTSAADAPPDAPHDAAAEAAAPTCTDGVQNGQETDTDCGGAICDAQGRTCGTGQKCLTAFDCTNRICGANFICPAPSCHDGVSNGGETGVDCGNAIATGCPACPAGQPCAISADCQSLHCANGACASATCSDGIQSGGESDVDCGAVCPFKTCASGKHCFANADCASGVCLAGGSCQ
jgi:hypothetical protein